MNWGVNHLPGRNFTLHEHSLQFLFHAAGEEQRGEHLMHPETRKIRLTVQKQLLHTFMENNILQSSLSK